jgi:hypothetical protein
MLSVTWRERYLGVHGVADDSRRPVAPPVEAPPSGSPGAKWRTLALAVLALAGLTFCCAVMLVLTGIIAEPETVIEQILRTLTGN